MQRQSMHRLRMHAGVGPGHAPGQGSTLAVLTRLRLRLFPAVLLVVTLVGVQFAAAPLAAAELLIATWNLEHLAARDGAGCRPRDGEDYAALGRVAERLDADIVALQEVENAAAVARVFDRDEYEIIISSRDARLSDDCRGMPGQARTPLRTGFVVRRASLNRQGLAWRARPAFEALGLEGLRWGTWLSIGRARITQNEGQRGADSRPDQTAQLELLSLHLKSGCHYGPLGSDSELRRLRRHQCQQLRRQRGILEEWVDAQVTMGRPFVLAGDFNRQLDQPNDHFWNALDDGEVCQWRPHPELGRQCLPGTARPELGVRLSLAGAGQPFPFPLNPRYPYAIDHILAGGPAADWLVEGSYEVLSYRERQPAPSDHHPVSVRVRLPWAPEVRSGLDEVQSSGNNQGLAGARCPAPHI